MKRSLCLVFAVIMVFSLLTVPAFAEIVDSGECGDSVTWSLSSDGVLTISGTGDMDDFSKFPPWEYSDAEVTKVIIDDGVTSIGIRAFNECESLTSITIPKSVKSIGSFAFFGCTSLTHITIPDGAESIGDRSFEGCSGLKNVTIPDSVTAIWRMAFKGCTSLESVAIGSGTAVIYEGAFYNCPSLESISVSDDNAAYFSYDGVLFNKDMTTLVCCPGARNGEYTVPDTVTYIDTYAFAYCANLTGIILPAGLEGFASHAFKYCNNLTSIDFSGENPDFVSLDGVIFSKNQGNLWCCPAGKSGEYLIPDSVWRIRDYAFDSCSKLTAVNIPDSVESIGACAFVGCNGLTEITIPDSVNTIKREAFAACENLKSVTVSSSAEYIEDYIFRDCYSLGSAIISDGITSVGVGMFANCYSLTEVTIPSSVTFIEEMAFDYCINLTDITIPSSVTYIYESAFAGCEKLTDVYYSGTPEQWNKIYMGLYNQYLTKATVHYIGSIGVVLEDMEGGGQQFVVTPVNVPVNSIIIQAIYKGSGLSGTETYLYDGNILKIPNTSGAVMVKFMAWDSMSAIRPLAGVKELNLQ